VVARSRAGTAAASDGRPVVCSGWPFIVGDSGRSSARSTVGATSISWTYGARPVLAEISQPAAANPGPEAIATCIWGRPLVTSEMPTTSSRLRPGRSSRAARSRPTASSTACSAASRRAGSVPVSVRTGAGVPAVVSWSSDTRLSGQAPSSCPRAAPVGSCSSRVSSTPARATATVGAVPTTPAHPTAAPSAPGWAPNRRVASSSPIRRTVATGSGNPVRATSCCRPQCASATSTASAAGSPPAAGGAASPSGSGTVGSGTGGTESSGPGNRARLPAPRVAQPSRRQVVDRAARTDSAPIAAPAASARICGVCPAVTSLQTRPGTPTTTTRSAW
jgi:hypothetical protein